MDSGRAHTRKLRAYEPHEAAVFLDEGRPESTMTIARNAREALENHVRLAVESIDRMYLNLYIPMLQTTGGVACFFRDHRGHDFASSALMAPMTEAFVGAMEQFAHQEGIEVIRFRKGQRKDDVAQAALKKFHGEEGILFMAKAQEKSRVIRTRCQRNPDTGASYPWLYESTAMVNQYYIYAVDRDFGPFFIKFGSYFPYNAKVCINGHEYLKRQLTQRGIAFEPLDNGILSCEDPKQLQRICDGLNEKKIEALVRKWLRRLPHPFTRADRNAGFQYDISILQAEFSLTLVFDRPRTGRIFFEQLIRDHIDLGRPEQVQLIFGRRVTRRTPGTFRTRLLTQGVIPSIRIYYKSSFLKQYFKEGRALRIETTINNPRDFAIGKKLKNLPLLRDAGFQANQRLLDVQRMSFDPTIGEDTFQQIHQPVNVDGQHAPALRFGDPRVLALMSALLVFRLLPRGFRNRELRQMVAPLQGSMPHMTSGMMTYDLRRLRLHGLIERIPKTQRYRVTDFGFRAALFTTRLYSRILCPGYAVLTPGAPPNDSRLRRAVEKVEDLIGASPTEPIAA